MTKTIPITSKNYTVAGKDEHIYYSIMYSEGTANETLSSMVIVDFKVREIFIQVRIKCHSLDSGRKNEVVFIKSFWHRKTFRKLNTSFSFFENWDIQQYIIMRQI